MLSSMDSRNCKEMVRDNAIYEQIDSTGNIPDYVPPSSTGQRKSYGSYQKIGMEDKLLFIKKELTDSISSQSLSTDDSLRKLMRQFCNENNQDEAFLQLYFDLLMSIVR